MIDSNKYDDPLTFGDNKLIQKLKYHHKKDFKTTKLTVDYKRLIKAGIEKNAALDLIRRLVESKK